MTQDEAFLQAIRDEPDSDTPRLVTSATLTVGGSAARSRDAGVMLAISE